MKHFSTVEAAKILGYNDDAYVRRLILSGRLKAQKISNSWVISEENLHKLMIERNILDKNKALIALNYELRALADKCMDGAINASSARLAVAHMFLGKSYKTHAAILALAEKGYGEDATVLSRSIFESFINLKYILSQNNDDLAVRYIAYDLVVQKVMLEDVMSEPESRKMFVDRSLRPKPGDTDMKSIKSNYKEVMDRYKFDSRYGWSGKTIEQLSTVAGRYRQYKTIYSLQCQLSHPSSRGMNSYYKPNGSGLIMDIGTSESYVEESLVMAFDYFGSLLDIVGDLMNWKIDEQLTSLLDRYEKSVHAINEKASA